MKNANHEALIDELVAQLDAAGIDSKALADSQVGQTMVRELMHGRWSITQLVANAKKCAIINPNLLIQESVVIDAKVTRTGVQR